MRDRELYAQILGIRSPWRVHDVALELDAGKVEVFVEAEPDAPMHCPHCQVPAPRYDKRRRRWRHLDTCQYQTVLVADLPRVSCSEHGVTQVHAPWAEPDSRFTALFEAVVIEWLGEASISAVARRMGLGWDAIDAIMARAVARGLARRDTTSDYPDLDVDEVAFRKGREYLTVVSDPGTGAVIHLAEGRTKASLSEFYDTLSEEQLGAIRTVSMDMWGAFIAATAEKVPGAAQKICFDRFHVAQHLGRAVDEVRRAEHKRLCAEGDKRLGGTRYDWLWGGGPRRAERREGFAALSASTLATARAWYWKEWARWLWDYRTRGWARRGWERWYRGAIRSRLEPIKRVARMVREHLWGIVNAIVTGTTNARAEGLNNRIRTLRGRAHGYRNKARMKRSIYFHFGGLDMRPAPLMN